MICRLVWGAGRRAATPISLWQWERRWLAGITCAASSSGIAFISGLLDTLAGALSLALAKSGFRFTATKPETASM
jgi:hypothetical protein